MHLAGIMLCLFLFPNQANSTQYSSQITLQQRCQAVNGSRSIVSLNLKDDLVALFDTKSEDGEDRFCVSRLLVFRQRYLALEAFRVLYKDSRGTSMQSRFASNPDCSFHRVFCHIRSLINRDKHPHIS